MTVATKVVRVDNLSTAVYLSELEFGDVFMIAAHLNDMYLRLDGFGGNKYTCIQLTDNKVPCFMQTEMNEATMVSKIENARVTLTVNL